MKKLSYISILSLVFIFSLGFLVSNTYAEEDTSSATSIRLMPVSKILQIQSNSTYDDSFEVFNDGDNEIKIEVYAAPYSYVYSENEDLYKLGFANENNFTQISRWITFADSTGNYVEKPTFSIPAQSSSKIDFKVTTPNNIPAGGQYAVIFAHTLTSVASTSGIRTEASPGIVIYGRSSEGEVITTAEITDLQVKQEGNIIASAKIKNTGNVDFTATGKLTIEPLIGTSSYGTDSDQPTSKISVIPEAELILTDQWTETPNFGIYKATWAVTVGENTETISRTFFLIPIWLIVLIIILLTILTIWIIIRIRKRKERRSRLAI